MLLLKYAVAFTLVTAMLGAAAPALAKRGPAPKVKPLNYRHLQFRAPNTLETMGQVQAWDRKSKKMVWKHLVYSIAVDPDLEEDVQWRFITSLKVQGKKLLVENEGGEKFTVELPPQLLKK